MSILRIDGSHESYELVWNDYIHVSIFNFLIVFIFLVVKLSEVIPSMTDTNLQTFETLKY